MSVYNFCARNILLPGSDILLKTEVSRCLGLFEKSQWWTRRALEQYQEKKVRFLIAHAYRNVPYYHDLLRSLDLKPDDFHGIRDLAKLPIISKSDIIKNRKLFLPKNIRMSSIVKGYTSGSTGKPFEYFLDRGSLSASRAIGLRSWGFAGYKLGDKLVSIAGSALLPKKMNLFKKASFKANRNLPLSSFNMDDERAKAYAKAICEFKPRFIRGYPGSISKIAKTILEEGLCSIKLDAVMTTAEMLYSSEENLIQEAFNCEVFDQCGCFDGGENLCECSEHSGYHIGMERSIHEFINKDGEQASSGEMSNVVLTDLWNLAMPLIRYDAGDMAIPIEDSCHCNRGLPLVKSIVGRRTDQISLPDGSLLAGLILTDIFEDEKITNKIIEYQIVQERIDSFTLNIIKGKTYSDETSKEIAQSLEMAIGIPLDVKFNFVDFIRLTDAGKRKIVISNVLNFPR